MIIYIILIIFILFLLYIIYNLYRRSNKLENLLLLSYEEINKYGKYIEDFSNNLSLIDSKLKEIDHRGTFSSDDEVGYVFKTIKLLMEKLQLYNINEYSEKEEEKK